MALLSGNWPLLQEKISPFFEELHNRLEQEFGWTAEEQNTWVRDNIEKLSQNAGAMLKSTAMATFEAVFNLILDNAVKYKVEVENMPTMILILSDMQFDEATRKGYYDSGRGYNPTVQELIAEKYRDAGYELPKIVYWNLNSYGNSPVQFHETETALISGFSPSLLTTVLKGESINPVKMMLDVVGSERYEKVTI
jgi:hypothetical protein